MTGRTASATCTWEVFRSPSDPRLAGLVSGRYGYREQAHGEVRRRMPASSTVPLVISFGDPLEVLGGDEDASGVRTHRSFVAGVGAGPAVTRSTGTQHAVQVDLTPLGAHRILGVSAHSLAHRVTDLVDVAPALTAGLPQQLASSPAWERRFALVDRILLRMAEHGPEPDPLVRWMWGRLRADPRRIRVGDLVRDSGRSHRHVTARFREQVGMTPKVAAGLLRFERAATHLVSHTSSLAEVAADHGYADQSHFTREFTRFAGETPIRYASGPGCRTST